jgi:hypothetical protein
MIHATAIAAATKYIHQLEESIGKLAKERGASQIRIAAFENVHVKIESSPFNKLTVT